MLTDRQARHMIAQCCKTIFVRAQNDPDSSLDTMVRQLRQTADLVEKEMTDPTPDEQFPQQIGDAMRQLDDPKAAAPRPRPVSPQQALQNFSVQNPAKQN